MNIAVLSSVDYIYSCVYVSIPAKYERLIITVNNHWVDYLEILLEICFFSSFIQVAIQVTL